MAMQKRRDRVLNEALEAAKFGQFTVLLDGNNFMIATSSVDSFIDWLPTKYRLLGAEGFTYDGKHLMPLMDCIIDYSYGDQAKSREFHKKILREDSFKKAQFIEFVVRI